jgi:adenine phosphoribosyltransferase
MVNDLSSYIRAVPGFPKPGIVFRDITTLLNNPVAFQSALEALHAPFKQSRIDKVVGIESRGFIFGALLANLFHAGFVPARKPGKLPAAVLREDYELEYGHDAIEIHTDAIRAGEQILVHDDLLATGGTAAATCRLIERMHGTIVGVSFLIELSFLNGRERLRPHAVHSVIRYDAENE